MKGMVRRQCPECDWHRDEPPMQLHSEERDGRWVVRVTQQSAIPALGAHVLEEHPGCQLAGEIRAAVAERGDLAQQVQGELNGMVRAVTADLARRAAAHVPHPVFEGGWRRPEPVDLIPPGDLVGAERRLSDAQWQRVLDLLPSKGERPKIIDRSAPPVRSGYVYRGRWAPPYDDEPHWAFTDPRTGKLMSTAETTAMMRRLRDTPLPAAYDPRHEEDR